MRLHSGGTQGPDPNHAKRLLVSGGCVVKNSEVKNQSHYLEE